jgi:hypothetical protein
MERFGTTCSGKLFWVWAIYAGLVTMLWDLVVAAQLPTIVAWLMAAALAVGALSVTGEL